MAPVTVTSAKPEVIFEPATNVLQRQFNVLNADVRVSWSKKDLEDGGGITFKAGTGRLIVGHTSTVGRPLYAIAVSSDAVVERDED